MRRLVFRFSYAILMCGSFGYKTAIDIGCPEKKLINFPYVVDSNRLISLASQSNLFTEFKEK